MKHSTRSTEFRSSRAILASLISFLIFFTPLTPLAVASPPSAKNRTPNVVSTETNAATSDAQTATHDNHAAVVSLANPAEPAAFLPSITATKVDSFPDTDGDGKAVPGEEITYTVTITNNGTTAATGVTFNDNFDSNTTFVPGSLQTQPIAFNDVASTFGNVRISTANGAINLIANDRDPDVGNGASSGLTASGPTTSANGGNVSISANGDFSYNPAPGFNGNDTFTYTVTDATGKTDTATVQITVGPTLIWFIDNTAAAGGDGRLTSPFNSITAYNASAPTKDPNDIIFIYQGSGAYTGNLTLTSGMKLIGQGFALQTETGAPPAGSDSLPGATANPTINSTSGNTVTLNQNNTIRGLTLNDAVGNDIIGNNFGTLTVSNVTISGTGRPLSLTTGTLAATFDQIISSNSSGGQGILLSAVGGSMAVTAGTSISGATTQGILVTGSTVSANFGNTSISGGTDGVSLQNNSSGTRTFGTLTVSGNTAVGFLHGAGGGTTNVTGATNITNPGGNGIDIQNSNAAISFAATTVGKNNAGTAVNLANNGTNTTSFSSLAITASNGAGLVTSAGGSLTVSTGSVTTTGTGVGVSLTNTTLNLTFTSISVTNGANGIVISGGSGSFTSGTTNLQSNAGADLTMSSSAVVANFGNTTSNSSAGAGVSLTSNTGNITFADLDITPDANNAGFVANSNTGTLTVTSGDITTSNAAAARAVTIDGPAGRTPINLTFTSITTTGVTESIHLVNVSGTKFQVTGTTQINTRAGTGILVNNSTATNIQFGTTNIPNVNNAGGYGIRVESSSSAVTVATATINNANITSGQTDAGTDFIPDNDGDGDAIFLKLNTGSFTLNGGTLSNCGNDCIDVRNSSALVLSGVTINTPGIDVAGGSGAGTGGHGIQAIGITGTNSITGGTITNFDTAARDGLRLIYTGATTATMTVQGTTFSDSTGGNGVLVLGRDTSNTTTTIGGPTNNVATNCTFSNLTAAGVLHGAGDNTGSTATTNLTIRNSTFTNPVALVDASNTISAHHANGGKATIQIIGNTLNNVARAASAQEGVISVSGDGTAAGNSLSLTIDNNTVSNIGGVAPNQCGAGAAPCLSYRGIQVFIDDQTNVSGTIYIRNNVLTNITRRGIYIDVANNTSPNNVNLVVSGNTIGTDAAPVGAIDATFQPGGEVGLSIEARRANPNAPNLNASVMNNSIRNRGANNSNPSLDLRAINDGTVSYTVTGNNINNLQATFREVRVITDDAATLCLDMSGNTLDSGNGLINVSDVNGGNVNVEQSSLAALAAANGIPAGNASQAGTPVYGVACAIPPTGVQNGTIGPGGDGDGEGGAEEEPTVEELTMTDNPATDNNAANGDADVQTASFSNISLTDDARPARRNRRDTNAVYFGALGTSNGREASYAPARYNALEGDAVYGREGRNTPTATREVVSRNNTATSTSSAVGRRAAQQEGGGAYPPTTPINIGTLNPGDSVTITFKVTVNNPLPGGVTQVSNQGTVSGSNFSDVPTDDPSTGAPNDPTITLIQPPPDIFVRDGSVSEPSTGSAPMTFTVVLSAASTNTVSVNFATANGGANPATAGSDYTTTTGTLTFAPGERVQTISVPVLADGDTSETDETFLVNLDTPLNANISDGQAVGTIKLTSDPGTTIISELRTSGPGSTGTGDANDEFVEIYNNTGSNVTVSVSDGSTGWALVKSGSACGATPVIIGVIPNGTVIPARGHYLFVGSGYSLGAYASGNQTLTAGIEDDRNVALFNTSNLINIGSTTRLDAVGFDLNTGNNCDLLREGSNLAGALGSITQYSFVRKFNSDPAGNGESIDTNNSLADFLVVSTTGAAVGNNPTPVLGAPGPENLASPIVRNHPVISSQLLDPAVSSSAAPNRVRVTGNYVDALSGTGSYPGGTISIRRKFTNNTGSDVTRLRFRIVDITTLNSPNVFGGATQSDLRAVTSADTTATVTGVGVVTVKGTTLETPPAQPNGGGVNSSLSSGTINLGAPLTNGSSINVQFLLGVKSGGKFQFLINIEALP